MSQTTNTTADTTADTSHTGPKIASTIEGYYQIHSRIYDATRWSFLFGRQAIIDRIANNTQAPTNILEIGCGTGKNLIALCKQFPAAQITGLDLSKDMLNVAENNLGDLTNRVTLLHQAYDGPLSDGDYDLILFSYALTMFNPGWDEAITAAHADLQDGGVIAVVDFHDSRWAWFKQWMGANHVRMDGHLLPKMASLFTDKVAEVNGAYAGVWQYVLYVGEK
ncbi:MAG: class I SAM-dependent methyltransferase [Chloroflexota bacterium]